MIQTNTKWLIIAVIALIVVGMLVQSKYEVFSIMPEGEYRSNTDCTFITNVAEGSNYRNSDGWVSLDDGQGMRGFGESGYSSFKCSQPGATILTVKTIEGNDICTRTGYSTRVYVEEGNYGVIFKSDSSHADEAITSCNGVCTPNCAGKSCGDDGCGGSCGTCPTGETCSSGICVEANGDCDCTTFQGLIDCANQWVSN